MLRRETGFNLVELLVVVVIIGVLTMIAYPAYQDHLRKTRRTDAKIALVEIANLQEKFFSGNEPPHYTATIVGTPGLNYRTTSANGYYALNLSNVTNTTFTATATATGAQAGDKDCLTFSITHTGAKTPSPPSKCWN